MILFILILGSVLTTALVSVDNYTREPIARNKAKKLRKSILESLGISYTKETIDTAFSQNIETKEHKAIKFYQAGTSGDIAFEINGIGLWGPIHGTVALTANLERIRGISIIHQEETPGLGGRIADADFLGRFQTKRISPGLIIQPAGKATGDNEIDGITGATLSCKAFEEILNSEIEKYITVIKENK
jgi:Na+-transporting NADH:ubiquinone oxidoreductase subunit C